LEKSLSEKCIALLCTCNYFYIEWGQKGTISNFEVLFILHYPSTKYGKLNPSFPVRAALFCFNSNVSTLYNNSVVK